MFMCKNLLVVVTLFPLKQSEDERYKQVKHGGDWTVSGLHRGSDHQGVIDVSTQRETQLQAGNQIVFHLRPRLVSQ